MSHSRKILSQAGTSLADVYDVEGSVVGLENLDVTDVKGVHELGGQIHSERLNMFGLLAATGTLAQNTTWAIVLGGFPDSVNRLLGVFVHADTPARVTHCSLAIRDPGTLVDHIIWMWDSVTDLESNVLWAGPAVTTQIALRTIEPNVAGGAPTLIARMGASRVMPDLVFRGLTAGFGAGLVNTRCEILVARPDRGNPGPGEPSSHGLPIPGW